MKTKTISLGIAAVAAASTLTGGYYSLPSNEVKVPKEVVTKDYRPLVNLNARAHKPSPPQPRVIIKKVYVTKVVIKKVYITKTIKVPTLPNIYCPQEDSCRWDYRGGKVWLQRIEDRTGDKLPPLPLGPWVQVSR